MDATLRALIAEGTPRHAGESVASAHVTMQRVVVRMLFDPVFVARVYEDPAGALDGLRLPEALVSQLLANDRRLFGADRLRRLRALKVLMEEFRVTSALVLLETRRLAFLDAFFSSPEFHASIQTRGYLALSFASYLGTACREGRLARPETRAVLTLETAFASSRRADREARRGARPTERAPAVRLPRARPGVVSVAVAKGTLDIVQAIEKYLFEAGLVPALALCSDAPTPEPLPRLVEHETEAYLLEPTDGGKVELAGIPLSYHHYLDALAAATSADDFGRRLRVFGIGHSDALAMETSLSEAGVLLPPVPPEPVG